MNEPAGIPMGGAAPSVPQGEDNPYVAAEEILWSGHPGHVSALNTYMTSVVIVPTILVFASGLAATVSQQAAFAVLGLIALSLGWAGWTYLTVRCHEMALTTRRLLVRTGVLNKSTDELELFRIKDIRAVEPFIYRMVGRGTVEVLSSDKSTPLVPLLAIEGVQDVRNTISQQVHLCRDAKGVREFD